MNKLFDTFLLSNDMTKGTGEKSHFHTHYSIGFILKGEHYLYRNTTLFTYGLEDLRVLNPYEVHSTYGNNWRYINISISKDTLEEYVKDIMQNNISFPINFNTKISKNKVINTLLKNYINSSDKLEKENIEHNFVDILLNQYVRDNTIEKVNLLHTKKELEIAKEYIHTNFSNPNLTIDNIASNINLSPFYFARSFKKTFELAPHRYIQNLRVDRAYKMIINKKHSLSEIAYTCGFSDQSHMIRLIKKYYGFTPTGLVV